MVIERIVSIVQTVKSNNRRKWTSTDITQAINDISQRYRQYTPERILEIITKGSENKWGAGATLLALKSDFKCAYCGLDFTASPENYKLWSEDHVVPKTKFTGDDPDRLDNMVACCDICNRRFKGRWDARKDAGDNATTEKLIAATISHINRQKESTWQELKWLNEVRR